MANFIAGLLTLFLGIIGQLIARVFLLDDNKWDHMWTIVFFIPPLSLVPAIMMWVGIIG